MNSLRYLPNGWFWHWQNEGREKRQPGWINGRAWLHMGRNRVLHTEWAHGLRHGFRIGLTLLRSHRAWLVSFSFGFGTWYLGWGEVEHFASHEYGARLWDDHFEITWGHNTETSRDDRRIHVNWLNVLLGRAKYQGEKESAVAVLVPLPERSYHGTVVMEWATWKRPRWFATTIRRAHLEMDKGEQLPIPGKGENSWDCNDDAIFARTAPAKTPQDAVGQIVGEILRIRKQRGWKPEQVAS